VQKKIVIIIFLCIIIILSSCNPDQISSEEPAPVSPTSTKSPPPSSTATSSQDLPPTHTPTPTLEPMGEFMQGVFYAVYWKEDFSKPYHPWTLSNVIKPLGANWISAHFLCEQMTDRSTEIICGENNRTMNSDVENIVNLAHSLGLCVFMEIGITVYENPEQFGVGFDDVQWNAWFEGYEAFITDYAAFAENLGVDMFSIGSELYPTQHREDNWCAVAAAVREVYHGPIIYSADARGSSISGEVWLDIDWWDAVDYIGIHPYDTALSTHNDPTVEEMVNNLTPIVNRLEDLSIEFNKPVIISELMYPSINGTSQGMGLMWDPNLTYEADLAEHANVHKALIEAFSERDWFRGLFIGDYSAGIILNPPNDILWSMYGKPAEEAIREFYGGTPQPTPTPFKTPDMTNKNLHDIFKDGFVNHWTYWPPDDNAELVYLNQTEIAVTGTAISVALDYWSDIWFTPPKDYPVSDYDWIIFDLYLSKDKVWNPSHGNTHPVTLMMVLYGGPNNATPFRVIFTDPPYLEGGVRANEWLTVRIPLDAFGLLVVPEIVSFSIQNLSENTVQIYVDNLKLMKE